MIESPELTPAAMLAEDEASLLEQLIDVTIDRDTYRLLVQLAIHQLHDLIADRDRKSEQHLRLLEQYRALREQIMREAAA